MEIRCDYCGDMVWCTYENAMLILNRKKKCKCSKCSRGKVWTTQGRE